MALKIKVKESATWAQMASLFQQRGYTPDDDVEGDDLVAYREYKTGIAYNAPEVVTVVAKFDEKADDLLVDVASSSYRRCCQNGYVKDMFYTFIGDEIEGVTVAKARELLRSAEKAADLYISALKAVRLG